LFVLFVLFMNYSFASGETHEQFTFVDVQLDDKLAFNVKPLTQTHLEQSPTFPSSFKSIPAVRMAAREHQLFLETDDATALLIIQLQLEDSRQLAADFHHENEGNNGAEEDAELALRLARGELEQNALLVQDHQIAAAVARGVNLHVARDEARQAARVIEDMVHADVIAALQPGK
jgi:hypothetical protein